MNYSLRFKYVCGKYGRTVATVLVVLSALLFVSGTVAETPEPQQETVQMNEQYVQTTLTASGTVVDDSALYDAGETVADSPVYLLSATPNLTVEALTTVPPKQRSTVTHRIILELGVQRQGTVFWTAQTTLANTTQLVNNGTARTRTTLDMAGLVTDRISAIKTETEGVGSVQARVMVNTSYDTGTYTGDATVSSPLGISDRSFTFNTPQRTERTHTTPVTRNASTGSDGTESLLAGIGVPGTSSRFLMFGLVSLLAAIAITFVNVRTGDFEEFQRHYETVRYSEWISRGRIPATGEYARVPVERLVDLVDIAIDCKKRVIYDPQQDYYALVDQNIVYEFRSETDGTGQLHTFGLAPLDVDEPTAQQAFEEAEATVASSDD
jgi:hypothetical protein